MHLKERYLDPFTDFGFKKIFGSEPNKDLLIDFLNELLDEEKKVKDLQYSKNEQLGKNSDARKAIFDLFCENEKGEKFIIELQKVKQQYFKDRSIYYSTFPIQEQALQGEWWDYQLKDIYTIGIMDFSFDDKHPQKFKHEVMLQEINTNEIFFDKLRFIYLEMSKFNKSASELANHFEKWLYLLKNLNQFRDIPLILQEKIFKKAFNIAEIANLNDEEMKEYEASIKAKRDWNSAMKTAIKEATKQGLEQGIEQGIQQGIQQGIEQGIEQGLEEGYEKGEKDGIRKNNIAIAKRLKKAGVDLNVISKSTGLSKDEIKKI